eukprot:Seg1508.6 transcript_id=Seg1508.6/GoldUCD/mRNA.D3Y31 product="Protein phosphatase 1 regulatory subunit 3C" protein_id=Seg1508.6/GoldUCD/D3Y31
MPVASLVSCFTLPEGETISKRINNEGIGFESFSVDDRKVIGINAVAFSKTENLENAEMKVRYTLNSWVTYEDLFCEHLKAKNRGDQETQKFKFAINVPPGMSLEFAICCRNTRTGAEIWDNNNGKNYKFTDIISS